MGGLRIIQAKSSRCLGYRSGWRVGIPEPDGGTPFGVAQGSVRWVADGSPDWDRMAKSAGATGAGALRVRRRGDGCNRSGWKRGLDGLRDEGDLDATVAKSHYRACT